MIDPRPEAILLDAGNTLVFVDGGRMHELLVRHGADPSAARFREAETEARLGLSKKMGGAVAVDEEGAWRDYFLHLFAATAVPREAWDAAGAELRAEHERAHMWSGVDPETPAALQALREAGYRLGVVSNADGRVATLLEQVGLAPHFEFIIDSAVVGVAKPDPRIFHMATRRMGLPPERCLYVGDLYAIDVVGARGAGLQALLLDPFDHFDLDVPRLATVADLPRRLGRGPTRGA